MISNTVSTRRSPSSFIHEIDGLRAVAVLAVLLFHTFPTAVPGGYIGVDIFFVISGFVISRSYLNDLIDGQVTLGYFYLKRVRRLTPAYFIVLGTSATFAYLLLEPVQLRDLGKSFLVQPFYVQNFVFWIEGDYFEGALNKPLLHTWSLAVEEQFYILFGLIIIFLRWKKAALVPLLMLMLITSLILGNEVSTSSPKSSFYLLPMRLWEFATGFLAFLATQKIQNKQAKPLDLTIYAFCLLLLFSSIFLFDNNSIYPGLQSIVAGFSTFALLILFERRPGKYNRVFYYGPIGYIGKISYSLYLWHWPIIVYLSWVLERGLFWFESIGAIVSSFMLASMTHHLLENPIRLKKILPSTDMLISWWAAGSAIVLIIGVSLVQTHGALFRYADPMVRTLYLASQERSPYRCPIFYRLTNFRKEICKINSVTRGPGVLVIGDSHADQLDEMIAKLGEAHEVPVYLAVRNCRIDQYNIRNHCNRQVLDRILLEVEKNNIKVIVTTSYWPSGNLRYEYFENNVQILTQEGLRIYISEMVPHGEYFDPVTRARNLIRKTGDNQSAYLISEYKQENKDLHNVLGRLVERFPEDVRLLSPIEYLCTVDGCDFSTNESPNYFDRHHLTKVGVNRLIPMYRRIFTLL